MFNKIKFIFLSFLFATMISNFSEASVLVNFSGHGIIKANHTALNAAATSNPKIFISMVVQNNATEAATTLSLINPLLTIMNTGASAACSSANFNGTNTMFMGGWLPGATLQTANIPMNPAPIGTPVIITAQENLGGAWTEGITIPVSTGTAGIYHIYFSGAVQWTCTRCAPGSITMSGSMSYSSNNTPLAGANTWGITGWSGTPSIPTFTPLPQGVIERQSVFPITFSSTKY